MNNLTMETYREELRNKIRSENHNENLILTKIDQLSFYYRTSPTDMLATVYEPSICIILQGSKEVGVGNELISYNQDKYLLASIHMPAQVRIVKASSNQPYLGLTITFSMEQIFDVLKDMPPVIKHYDKSQRGLYFGDMNVQLLESVTRLVRLLDSPQDIPVLSSLIIKEILYTVMRGKGGDVIRKYVQDGTAEQRVVQAISKIKDKYNQPLKVQELARSLSMSESSLYHSFKKLTAMSPIQFQKSIRLQEARKQLISKNIEVAQVAFEVGYESPSQFSREYSRMFGLPPKADIKQMHKL